MSSIEDRLTALEAAVARLIDGGRAFAEPGDGGDEALRAGGDFWLLEELLRRHSGGALAYGGHAQLPAGPVRWQIGVDPDVLLDSDWDAQSTRLAALAHPVRLRLLQLVLSGRTTTAELADDDELGTTGQLHHHLRPLVAAGWLASAGRGRYTVPAARVVPLLLIVAAAGE